MSYKWYDDDYFVGKLVVVAFVIIILYCYVIKNGGL